MGQLSIILTDTPDARYRIPVTAQSTPYAVLCGWAVSSLDRSGLAVLPVSGTEFQIRSDGCLIGTAIYDENDLTTYRPFQPISGTITDACLVGLSRQVCFVCAMCFTAAFEPHVLIVTRLRANQAILGRATYCPPCFASIGLALTPTA